MASAGEWVRQIVANSLEQPMGVEAVWKSLEKHVGQGDKALGRLEDVLSYIDGELVERRGGLVMREIWNAVADYRDRYQESVAAA